MAVFRSCGGWGGVRYFVGYDLRAVIGIRVLSYFFFLELGVDCFFKLCFIVRRWVVRLFFFV